MSAYAPIAGGIPLHALAEELILASRMLAELAFELGSDEATLRRHMTSLQKIDHVTQIQLAVVDLLRGGPGGELGSVPLDDMARRLAETART